ncbi:flagellar transcriptional activator FlhD [Ewingella americana]|nr:flagellar transcriptional activator FlhD [Ewingella americana]
MPEFCNCVYDINLSYLLFAQRLIKDDKALATFRLGIDGEVADVLISLTLEKMMKLAETNQLLFQFRFSDSKTIEHLTQESRVEDLKQIHTGILLASNLLRGLSAIDNSTSDQR